MAPVNPRASLTTPGSVTPLQSKPPVFEVPPACETCHSHHLNNLHKCRSSLSINTSAISDHDETPVSPAYTPNMPPTPTPSLVHNDIPGYLQDLPQSFDEALARLLTSTPIGETAHVFPDNRNVPSTTPPPGCDEIAAIDGINIALGKPDLLDPLEIREREEDQTVTEGIEVHGDTVEPLSIETSGLGLQSIAIQDSVHNTCTVSDDYLAEFLSGPDVKFPHNQSYS